MAKAKKAPKTSDKQPDVKPGNDPGYGRDPDVHIPPPDADENDEVEFDEQMGSID